MSLPVADGIQEDHSAAHRKIEDDGHDHYIGDLSVLSWALFCPFLVNNHRV